MKHKTYIAALLAGMLALAGCGGGGSGTGTGDGDGDKQTASDCTAEQTFNETTKMCENKPVAPTSKLPAGVTKVDLNLPAIGQNLNSAPRNNRAEDKFLVFGKTDEPKTWAEALGATSRTVYKNLGLGIGGPAENRATATGPAVRISGNAARIKLGTVTNTKIEAGTPTPSENIKIASDSTTDIVITIGSVGTDNTKDERTVSVDVPEEPNTGITILHKGIPGKLICGSTGCGVSYSIDKTNPTADNKLNVYGTFTGDWYFVADAAEQGKEWVSNPKGGYRNRTQSAYAEWGYWLSGSGSDRTLQRYWKSGGADANDLVLESYVEFNKGKTSGRLAADGNTATYNGTAFGVSSTKDADGEQTGVGSFEATASLTATFGVSPKLKGTIDRFTGDAVGTWSLELTEAGIKGLEANGSTNGGKDAKSTGVWSAEVYGEMDKRPAGVVGGFTGHFSDGDASGVFHATPGS